MVFSIAARFRCALRASLFGRSKDPAKPIPGSIDRIVRVSENEVLIRGWMLDPAPEGRMDSIQIHVNGKHVGPASHVQRHDVASRFSWVHHADSAGYEARLNVSNFSSTGLNKIKVIGCRRSIHARTFTGALRRLVGLENTFGIPVGRHRSLCRLDIESVAPTPPDHLMDRVAGHHDLIAFRTNGLGLYGDFLDAMSPYCKLRPSHRLLDWGCGCGRSTAHFLAHPNGPEVHGCDIDGEAIAWCQANLPQGCFAHAGQLPPLPYPDGHFDAIVSCSVFSHLQRDLQHQWLAELRRILKPGALLLASFHGQFAATVAYSPDKVALLLSAGIVDDTLDGALGDIAEKDYYRSTFQTREYTLREWSKHFEILDYIVAGMGNYQDLLVMRRASACKK